jgi:Fur family ferric uptake transcriptional regulator
MDPDKNSIIHLLREKSINRTAARIEVLRVMMQSRNMQSLTAIVRMMNDSYNRVTVYRVLCMLCEKELIYKLVDLQNNAYYRFNETIGKNDFTRQGRDEVFFKCNRCGKITFIETPLPEYALPQGFVKTATNFLVSGYCRQCATRTSHQSPS